MGVWKNGLKALALIAAALGAAVLVWVAFTLPPRPLALPPPSWAPPTALVRGVLHIHSVRSDGTGSVDDIAAAAARAGLDFIVLTDHGDGTREPDPPAYRAGVLCLDGVEISTRGGHYVAVGMRRAPYPLGGEPRDVVEDVRRLGGFGIAAHPDSPKPELKWTAWDAPIDAFEWLNLDSEWRDESTTGLLRLLLSYPLRGAAAIAGSLRRPEALLARWDALTRHRPVVALAGADAHARFAIGAHPDPYQGPSLPGLPTYEASFRVFSVGVEVARPFSRSASEDAALLIEALRGGHAFTAIDALAGPAAFEFTAESGAARAGAGSRIDPDGPVTFRVRTNAPEGSTTVLLRNGEIIGEGAGPSLWHVSPPVAGAYRVEVRVPGAPGSPPVPWIVSNPIYVGVVEAAGPETRRPSQQSVALLDPGRLSDWHVEHEARSEAQVTRGEPPDESEWRFAFRLGSGEPAGQFAALVRPLERDWLPSAGRIVFRTRSDVPMRLSVQLRAPGGRDGQRWQRSVYVDEEPREVTVLIDDMRPIGPTDSERPPLEHIDALLLVVDTTNARGGAAGRVWLSDVRLER
jgi:hypothetical protein